jgi:2-polyprenyl-6-methoxyphenol hydroxylase-like FAD-dependent oxidoreductase
MTRTAIIIGNGIAGPLTALGLKKAGVEATVYEAYPEHAGREAGSWLTIAVNGLQALRTLGVHDAVKAVGFPADLIEFASGSGKYLGAVPIGGTLADGSVTHTLKRSELLRVLAAAVRDANIPIIYDKRLVAAAHDETGVIAYFSDGTHARADFIVGADGVHSQLRRLIDPNAPKPTYSRLLNFGGFTPAAHTQLPAGAYHMVFGKRAFFGYTVAPSREVWWFVNLSSDRELTRDELRAIDWRARLREAFSDDEGPMLDLIDATPGAIAGFPTFELETVPHWQLGRMVILGDAAHAASPSTGQGASMAAEDAVTLAKCVRDHADVESALTAFVMARRPRAEQVVAHGKRYANMKLVGPVGRFFRDLMLPAIFRRQRSQGPESLAWLFDHRIDWNAHEATPRSEKLHEQVSSV